MRLHATRAADVHLPSGGPSFDEIDDHGGDNHITRVRGALRFDVEGQRLELHRHPFIADSAKSYPELWIAVDVTPLDALPSYALIAQLLTSAVFYRNGKPTNDKANLLTVAVNKGRWRVETNGGPRRAPGPGRSYCDAGPAAPGKAARKLIRLRCHPTAGRIETYTVSATGAILPLDVTAPARVGIPGAGAHLKTGLYKPALVGRRYRLDWRGIYVATSRAEALGLFH